MKTKKIGFTLIELMVVMAIIAVLSVLIIGAITVARNTATETAHRSNAKAIQTGLEASYTKFAQYCGATGQPACGTSSFKTAASTTHYNVTLSTDSGTCVNDGSYDGGGTITTTTSGYTITPYNIKCGTSTPATADAMTGNVITGP